MWIDHKLDSYITEIQRQFVEVYKFPARDDAPAIPRHVPDGEYPMWINHKLDTVRVVDGRISCYNFEQPQTPNPP